MAPDGLCLAAFPCALPTPADAPPGGPVPEAARWSRRARRLACGLALSPVPVAVATRSTLARCCYARLLPPLCVVMT